MKLRINLFGNFEITYGKNSISDIDTPRQQELLTYLLLNRGKSVERSQLSYLFWLESNDKQAKANLRNLLHTVRNNLQDADQFIKVDHNSIKWKSEKGVELDVYEFEKSIENARIAKKNNKLDKQENELKNGVALYSGHLVPNCYSDWIEDYRNSYKQSYLKALKGLIDILEKKGDYYEAIDYGNTLVQTEPYDEKSWQQLIKLYALNDNRAKAIRTYKECEKTLRDELDITPSIETRELYEHILNNYQSATGKKTVEIFQSDSVENEFGKSNHKSGSELSTKISTTFRDSEILSGRKSFKYAESKNSFLKWLHRFSIKKAISYALIVISFISIIVLSIFESQSDNYIDIEESRKTIAILPLEDLSESHENIRFTKSFTDILNNNLARAQNLRVISYNTVDFYSKNYEQARLISDLGLDYLIEGSVQVIQDRVRVNIQVLNAVTNEYIWSVSYMRLLDDVLILQSQIAEDIVGRIESAFQMDNNFHLPNPGKVNPVAFELYLKGIEEQSKKDFLGYRQSVTLFRQSIAIDSSFALAYSHLAFTYVMLELVITDANYKNEITSHINKALELNPNSSMAYVALGMHQHLLNYQWALADESFKMAINLNASSYVAHNEYAQYLLRLGNFEKAIRHGKIALSLNPISPDLQSGIGEIYLYKRDYEKAIIELKKALDIDPTYVIANFWLTRAYIHNQDYKNALQTNDNFSGQGGFNFKSEILAYMGQKEEAMDLLKELKSAYLKYPYKTYIAQIIYVTYIALEEKQEAIDWFLQAYQHDRGWLTYTKVNPVLDYIRNEPEYKEIESKIFPVEPKM